MTKRMLPPGIALALLVFAGVLHADDDWGWSGRRPTVPPVHNSIYAEECGSCHFAYQPALLPTGSWEKMLTRLDNHFGENAEVSEEILYELYTYLLNNAADKVNGYKRVRKIMRSLGSNTPLRITEVPYIRRQHDEIPGWVITDNPGIRSLSNCANCHIGAESGSYAEREIRIPGQGRWEDE